MVIKMKLNRKQILWIIVSVLVLVGLIWWLIPHYVPAEIQKDKSIGTGQVSINRMQDIQNKEKVSISFKKMENTQPVYLYVDGHYLKKVAIDSSNETTTVTLGSGKVSDVGQHQLQCVQYRTWYPSSQILFERTLEYSIR